VRLRTPLLWALFLGSLFAGVALLLAGPATTPWGVGVLLLPLVVLAAVTLAHYAANRRKAADGPKGPSGGP